MTDTATAPTRQQMLAAVTRYSASAWAITYKTLSINHQFVKDGGEAYEDVKIVTITLPTRKLAVAEIERALANGRTLEGRHLCADRR